MDESDDGSVWVFNGNKSKFPGAIFTSREKAEIWIKSDSLEGILTKYPLDVSVYDWATVNGFFTPKKPHHREADWIACFTTACQDHYHYEAGDGVSQISVSALGKEP